MVQEKTERNRAVCPVAIVDDEPGMRVLLSRLFETAGIRSQAYASAESLLEDVSRTKFGCLVVDIGLGGISGLDLQSELRRRCPDVAIVVISGRATVADAVRAFRNRASAFFEKPFDNRELLSAVQELVVDWEQRQSKLQAVESLLSPLSSREREVLEALMAGKKTVQVAHELNISASTVEKHRLRIFEKTGVDSIIELIHLTAV
jgi:FixJ family two-component response regulator